MRVLEISVRADIGGGPEHLFRLIEDAGTRVSVVVACPQEEPYWSKFKDLPNVVAMVDIPHRSFSVRSLVKLQTVTRQHSIEIIHSHGKGAGVYGRLLSIITGIVCIHTFHGVHVGGYGSLKRRLYLALERVFGAVTAFSISVSDSEKSLIQANRLAPESRVIVINNGVVVPAEKPKDISSGFLDIISVSRFDRQKNTELLLDIAVGLREAVGEKFRITVLGDGIGRQSLIEKARLLGLEEVLLFPGAHPSPRDVFRESDVFISTSRWEGMPLAVLEAMSEGIPVVATDVVGNRDVVSHGTTGYLYPSEDSSAAVRILSNIDREELYLMGKASRVKVLEKYSVGAMVEKTLDIYRASLNNTFS